jgi:hypothetical protein
MQRGRTILLTCSRYLLFVLLVSLAVLEGLYRWQVVDTYSPELRTLNSPEDLSADSRPTVLIMGDSFTASSGSYAGILKQMVPQLRIINGGVSGTGVVQAEFMARHRFHAFHPSIFIYQIYVGNDLLDIRYPVNWGGAIGRAKSLLADRQSVAIDQLRQLPAWSDRPSRSWRNSAAIGRGGSPGFCRRDERLVLRGEV